MATCRRQCRWSFCRWRRSEEVKEEEEEEEEEGIRCHQS